MLFMMMSANPNDLPINHNQIIMSQDHHHQDHEAIIINSSCPISWKLYDNPFFATTNTSSISPLKLKPKQLQRKYSASAKFVHHHHHSSSSSSSSDHHHKMNNSCSSDDVEELKAELEKERKQRKKIEALNKKLSRELVDQVEKAKLCDCDDLKKEISRLKEEMEKMKQEMVEERKMLRMAEVLREERVQMKLKDAHHLFYHHNFLNQILLQQNQGKNPSFNSCEESKKMSLSGKSVNLQRKVSPEAENPHIKQGIKGFVEFQRAIKAKNGGNCSNNYGGSKNSKDVSSYNKLECQKAQLRVLFKHKYPVPYSQNNDHIIIS